MGYTESWRSFRSLSPRDTPSVYHLLYHLLRACTRSHLILKHSRENCCKQLDCESTLSFCVLDGLRTYSQTTISEDGLPCSAKRNPHHYPTTTILEEGNYQDDASRGKPSVLIYSDEGLLKTWVKVYNPDVIDKLQKSSPISFKEIGPNQSWYLFWSWSYVQSCFLERHSRRVSLSCR